MSELPPNLRKFLDDTRDAHDPSSAANARVWSRLGGRLGLPLPPLPAPVMKSAPPPPPPPAAAPAPASALPHVLGTGAKVAAAKVALAKLVSGALLVAAGGAAVGTYDRVVAHTSQTAPVASVSSLASPPTPSAAPEVAATVLVPTAAPSEALVDAPVASSTSPIASPLPSPTVVPFTVPAAIPRATAANAASVTSGTGVTPGTRQADDEAAASAGPSALTTPNAGTLAGELTLLREAEAALGRGDAATALARTDEHARLFPVGTLRQERMATRALALCAVHRDGEAQTLASTLAAEAPRSPYADRLRVSCAGWPTR